MTDIINANSAKVVLHGASYSVYVRIVQLVLMEKGIDFNHHEIDIFSEAGVGNEYLRLNPFGKIPTLEHENFILYETCAIARYIDAAFDNSPTLTPSDVQECARMDQIVAILDNYAYQSMVWDVYVEACESEIPDADKIAKSMITVKTCLQAIEDIADGGSYLVGGTLSIADIHAAPMFDYFMKSEAGQLTIPGYPKLSNWWSNMQKRPSCHRLLGG